MPAYLHNDRKGKKKSYYYEFQHNKRKYKKSGFSRKKDAEQAEDELKVKLRSGTYINEVEDDFNTHITNWLDRRTDLGANTEDQNRRNIKTHILPVMRGKKLKEVRPIDIQRLLDLMRDRGSSLSVQEKVYNILNKMFRDSQRLQLISQNPVQGVAKPKDRAKGKVDILNVEDLTFFLEFSRMYTRYFFAFFLAAHTGLRRGEILGIKWEDIDLINKRLDINKRAVKAAWGTPDYLQAGTKNGENRNIALSDLLIEELLLYKEQQDKEKEHPEYEDNGLVIATQKGTHVYPDALGRAFKKTYKASALSNDIKGMHILRHTHASLLLIAGVSMKVVSERLGHSSIKITMDTYSHLLPKTEQEAADKFADLFQKSGPTPPEITREDNLEVIEEDLEIIVKP